MPTLARDRAPLHRRRLLPTALLTAIVALLAFAGTAAAETKVGEVTSPPNQAISAEADILTAKAVYEPSTGAVTFTATTRGPVNPNPELGLETALFTSSKPCSVLATQEPSYPVIVMDASYNESIGEWFTLESVSPSAPQDFGPAPMTVEGATLNLGATTTAAANRPYDCALVATFEESSGEVDSVAFPIATLAAKETVTTTTTPQPAPAPAPAPPPPGVLSIAKAKKPLKLKVGKWATVKVKVTNTGGTATGPGALRVKAPAGVLVKPERQKVPILAPGGSWTISVRVQLTDRAKPKTMLALTGTAPGLNAKGTLVVRRAGG